MKTWSLCFVFVAILTVLQLNAVFAQNKQKFKVFNDTDIPGYDYRSPQNDNSLRNISSKGCIKACAKDNRCRAFTYNKKAKVCFLKTVGLKRKKFRGALSGIKVGKQGQFNLAGPDFQQMPFSAKSCQDDLAAIKKLQQSLKLEVTQNKLAVGDVLKVKWSKGANPQIRVPVYLMISTKSPIRFRGKGFYALLPEAKAAFNIATFKEATRAIVPLYGKGVPKTGTVNILPLLAEPLELNWSVVGYVRKCGETHASENTPITIDVKAGTPRIVIDDPFSLVQPKQRYISPDKTRVLEVYQNFFRLKDPRNGNVITHHQGKNPRFSPTGRFYTAASENVIGSVELYDSVSGEKLGKTTASAWANNDSFIFVDHLAYGGVSIKSLLIENGEVYASNSMSCYACTGWEHASVKIDLENNVFVVAPFLERFMRTTYMLKA